MSEPTTESLRELTGAPDLTEPLVSDDAFQDLGVSPSPRPVWKRPVPKLMLIGILLMPIFGLAGLFLGISRQESPQRADAPEPEAAETPDSELAKELQQAKADIAALKSQMALEDQAYVAQRLPEAAPTHPLPEPADSSASAPVSPAPRATSTPAPTVSQRPATQPVRAAPTPTPRTEVNPQERWMRLARVGSYGGVMPEMPATQPVFSDSPPAMASAAPAILVAAEARILQEASLMLVAGTHSAGELATPVVAEGSPDDRFLVVLKEPLIDSQGNTAIPVGGALIVQVDGVSDTGMVRLSANQAQWQEEGGQRTLNLPKGAVLIRGDEGTPLIASKYGDPGDEIAAMDAAQFALGAIRRTSELYTRPNSRIETGSGTTVITEENPAPDILAGVLEGGTDALLDTMSDRNKVAIKALQERRRVAYLEAGRPVQVFVNQSLPIPL